MNVVRLGIDLYNSSRRHDEARLEINLHISMERFCEGDRRLACRTEVS